MVEEVKKMVSMEPNLNVEQRNLLSVAYKNVVGQVRAARRALSADAVSEDQKDAGFEKLYADPQATGHSPPTGSFIPLCVVFDSMPDPKHADVWRTSETALCQNCVHGAVTSSSCSTLSSCLPAPRMRAVSSTSRCVVVQQATRSHAPLFLALHSLWCATNVQMKGDYYRYLAEVDYDSSATTAATASSSSSSSSSGAAASSSDKKGAGSGSKATSADLAKEAYTEATELAAHRFNATHPVRLGLALNFSVFVHEIGNDPDAAIKLAKNVRAPLTLKFTCLLLLCVSRCESCVLILSLSANVGD